MINPRAPSNLPRAFLCAMFVVAAETAPLHAGELVRDAWTDGTRSDPAAAEGYVEQGDADQDGDVEAAWFDGGGGGLEPIADGKGLRASTVEGASSSWTVYFAPEDKPAKLEQPGDKLTLTWKFTPTGVNEYDAGQAFRVALVDTPAAARLSSNGSPKDAAYAGYALFMNMNTVLSHSSPFQLRKRSDPATAAPLLSSSGPWTSVASQEFEGATGYEEGTEYTLTLTATRGENGKLDLVGKMAGGNLGDDGALEVTYADAESSTLEFDTFAVRPTTQEGSAKQFDMTLFQVDQSAAGAGGGE